MTGRTIDRMYPELPPLADGRAAGARGPRPPRRAACSGVSFTLRRGEILGVGGLAGQGQRDLFMTLFGARKASRRRGPDRRPAAADPQAGGRDPAPDGHRARARGPQDRGADAADVGARQPDAGGARPGRLPRRPQARARAGVRPARGRSASRSAPAGRRCRRSATLSGGNQQKVLIGTLAARRVGRPAPLRHHARRRRRHEARHLRADDGARRRGQVAPLLLERDRGDGAALPPRARHARGPRRRRARRRANDRRRGDRRRRRCGSTRRDDGRERSAPACTGAAAGSSTSRSSRRRCCSR